MFSIHSCPLPENALLDAYRRAGAYTDCYSTVIPATISQEQYMTAFYTSWVFKLERHVLKWTVSRPSTDGQARQLAAGAIEEFAVWHVERRAANQVLLCDMYGSTRSWLMIAPMESGTRLYFGSAVVPTGKSRTGKPEIGFVFRALMGFHKLYSLVLLRAAKARLQKTL